MAQFPQLKVITLPSHQICLIFTDPRPHSHATLQHFIVESVQLDHRESDGKVPSSVTEQQTVTQKARLAQTTAQQILKQ